MVVSNAHADVAHALDASSMRCVALLAEVTRDKKYSYHASINITRRQSSIKSLSLPRPISCIHVLCASNEGCIASWILFFLKKKKDKWTFKRKKNFFLFIQLNFFVQSLGLQKRH